MVMTAFGLRLRSWFPGLARQAALAGVSLESGLPVRLGESAVASTMVHVLAPRDPGDVHVLVDRDAGRVFYGRSDRGRVVHLDVFHEVADLDHRRVAEALREALAAYASDFPDGASEGGGASGAASADSLAGGLGGPAASGAPGTDAVGAVTSAAVARWADWIDLQTATGGGRLSGELAGGRKASLRRAHRNHAHITLMLPRGGYALLFYLVAAAEAAIAAQGLEIRRVETVVLRQGGGPAHPGERGLEAYRDRSDSLLNGAAGAPEWQRRFSRAVELAERMEGAAAARELLERLAEGVPVPVSPSVAGSPPPAAGDADPSGQRAVLVWLRREGLLDGGPGRPRLNAAGRRLRDFLTQHALEVDQALKRLARTRLSGPGRRPAAVRKGGAEARNGRGRRLALWRPGEPLAEPALPETLTAAAARCLAAAGAAPAPGASFALPPAPGPRPVPAPALVPQAAPALRPGPCPSLRVEPLDLRRWERSRNRALDLCLLIDASASMAGPRIAAAKELARHLVLQTRDRVAVVTFQERQVDVAVPFTRNYTLVQDGLRRIRPAGLTPLALGLREAARTVQGRGGRRSLVVLITDGIPTVSIASVDPLADALAEAARLADRRVRLACIGLLPNASFLRRLAAAAGGSLHVVDDLERDTLLTIAHAERQALVGRPGR